MTVIETWLHFQQIIKIDLMLADSLSLLINYYELLLNAVPVPDIHYLVYPIPHYLVYSIPHYLVYPIPHYLVYPIPHYLVYPIPHYLVYPIPHYLAYTVLNTL